MSSLFFFFFLLAVFVFLVLLWTPLCFLLLFCSLLLLFQFFTVLLLFFMDLTHLFIAYLQLFFLKILKCHNSIQNLNRVLYRFANRNLSLKTNNLLILIYDTFLFKDQYIRKIKPFTACLHNLFPSIWHTFHYTVITLYPILLLTFLHLHIWEIVIMSSNHNAFELISLL